MVNLLQRLITDYFFMDFSRRSAEWGMVIHAYVPEYLLSVAEYARFGVSAIACSILSWRLSE